MTADVIRKMERPSAEPRGFQGAVRGLASNEVIFAVVGPVGSGTSTIATSLKSLLDTMGRTTYILKARTTIDAFAKTAGFAIPTEPGLSQSRAFQDAGDKLRETKADNSAVAVGLIEQIRLKRAELQKKDPKEGAIEPDGQPRAYILDSLRHPDEVSLLRHVYQDSFYLVGVFCYEEERLSRLQNGKYSSAGADDIVKFMERDENAPESHGQKVTDAFHLADYFVDNSVSRFKVVAGRREENKDWTVADQLSRLVNIIFHLTIIRPTLAEAGMFSAYGAKMRSSCLSRQVGAALLDAEGSLIATGTNEVPRAGGGVYGSLLPVLGADTPQETEEDFRCFVRNKYCSNTRAQNDIIRALFKDVRELQSITLTDELLKRVRRTRIGQLIEYSRAVHAEMDALMSAARSGTSTTGTRMFVTTFPCHNCARHIVAAGVLEVQYIEPYLKSQAVPLHGDAIVTSPKDWRQPNIAARSGNANVLFHPFIGVAPRLYRRAFLKDRDLKDNTSGDLLPTFGAPEGHAATETLRVSYAQVEAKLAEI